MNVNLEYYRIFYYVAKYQNFTRAARALGNSQPNVTRAMNLLEQEIHCTLFIRTNRGVRLTPEGEKLYIRVSAAMEQLQNAEEELRDSSGLEHGSIAIGASETALNIYLLEKLRTFHMEYPGIRLKIYNHSTPQAVQSEKNGEIDFAVVATPTEGGSVSIPGDSGGRKDVHCAGKSGTVVGRSTELSFYLPGTGDPDLVYWMRNPTTYRLSVGGTFCFVKT